MIMYAIAAAAFAFDCRVPINYGSPYIDRLIIRIQKINTV